MENNNSCHLVLAKCQALAIISFHPYISQLLSLLSRFKQLWHQQVQTSQVVLVVKNPPANAGDRRDKGLISGSGGFPGRRRGNPF